MSGDDKKGDNKVLYRGDTIERIRPLDEVVVCGNGTEQSKEYKERVKALDDALSIRSPNLERLSTAVNTMQEAVGDIDNFEEKINEVLSKYGVAAENVDEFDLSQLSKKDKKQLEKILNKEFSKVNKSFSKAKDILTDDKKKNKQINKDLKEVTKEIKKYEKKHPYAKVLRLRKEYADALQILLLEDKNSAVYKQAKKVVKDYQKLHKNGKYFSSKDIFVEPLQGDTNGFYDGRNIYIDEPRLNAKGMLKNDPFDQGDPTAFNRTVVHEGGHKKDGEYAGANNLFFKEHVLMSERLTENLSKASEYLYIAEQWSLCKKAGMEWYEFTNVAGWPSRVKVDDMLKQCPGLKEAISENGFNPEKEEDVRKVIKVAGKYWHDTFENAYNEQGIENAKKAQVTGEILGRGFELMAKQNQYYGEVEKRMLSNVYTCYRTYDLSPYKDLLNPLSKEEALQWLSDSDKLITADMMEKINNYFDTHNVSAKDKDAYFAVALEKVMDVKGNASALSSLQLDEKVVTDVKDIMNSYGYMAGVRAELSQQRGESGINPKANMQNFRIDKAYQKRGDESEDKELSIKKESHRIDVMTNGGQERD